MKKLLLILFTFSIFVSQAQLGRHFPRAISVGNATTYAVWTVGSAFTTVTGSGKILNLNDGSNGYGSRTDIGILVGQKVYYELDYTTAGGTLIPFGLANASEVYTNWGGQSVNSYGVTEGGLGLHSGGGFAYSGTVTIRVGVIIDMTGVLGTIDLYYMDVWQGQLANDLALVTWYPYGSTLNTIGTITIYTNPSDFTYPSRGAGCRMGIYTP